MRSGAIPFQFDISRVLHQFAGVPDARPAASRLDLPFLSVLIEFTPVERNSARTLLIRLRDRRVLSAQECCDGCIDDALRSLQEIRSILLDQQVELANDSGRALNLLTDLMSVAIRQFLTFEQRISQRTEFDSQGPSRRHPDDLQQYFDALELLRGHLSRCLGQVAVIAGMSVPSDGLLEEYRGPWPLEAYKVPSLDLSARSPTPDQAGSAVERLAAQRARTGGP
jgi:hypothetical protein